MLLAIAAPAQTAIATVPHAATPPATAPRPILPRSTAPAQAYRDSHFGVRFRVPSGWDFSRKDRMVSTFHLDARSAVPGSEMRAVATLDVNPFPLSTLSGAFFYYSVETHTTDTECAHQATSFATPAAASQAAEKQTVLPTQLESHAAQQARDIQNIGGMDFLHGHDEHGGICIEARDDIYTAFRKGSCYRFDLEVNTFCSVVSGAYDLTGEQMREIEERMTGILSTVALDWEKSGPHPVPPPESPEQPPTEHKPLPSPEPPPPPGVATSR